MKHIKNITKYFKPKYNNILRKSSMLTITQDYITDGFWAFKKEYFPFYLIAKKVEKANRRSIDNSKIKEVFDRVIPKEKKLLTPECVIFEDRDIKLKFNTGTTINVYFYSLLMSLNIIDNSQLLLWQEEDIKKPILVDYKGESIGLIMPMI